MSKEIELKLTWEEDDPLLESEHFQTNLGRRWDKRGNLPISVFQIFISSKAQLYKVASFFRRPNDYLFSKLAVDEIYLMNAIECSNTPVILNLLHYIGVV